MPAGLWRAYCMDMDTTDGAIRRRTLQEYLRTIFSTCSICSVGLTCIGTAISPTRLWVWLVHFRMADATSNRLNFAAVYVEFCRRFCRAVRSHIPELRGGKGHCCCCPLAASPQGGGTGTTTATSPRQQSQTAAAAAAAAAVPDSSSSSPRQQQQQVNLSSLVSVVPFALCYHTSCVSSGVCVQLTHMHIMMTGVYTTFLISGLRVHRPFR